MLQHGSHSKSASADSNAGRIPVFSSESQISEETCIAQTVAHDNDVVPLLVDPRYVPSNVRRCEKCKDINSFTVSNALMHWGVVFCKWQQRINAFGAIFGFKKYQNDRHWLYIISTDCYTCTLTI